MTAHQHRLDAIETSPLSTQAGVKEDSMLRRPLISHFAQSNAEHYAEHFAEAFCVQTVVAGVLLADMA